MESKTFIVNNINCGHCTAAIKEEVGEMAGVASVSAEINTKQVTVQWQQPATWPAIAELLQEINYPVSN